MNILKQYRWSVSLSVLFALFVLISLGTGFEPGATMGRHFVSFLWQMLKVLPCVFVLIGLFDVWVRRKTVEKHLGQGSGPLSYLWAVLLAGTMVGGIHVAFPVAHALHEKRAKLGVVLAFLSASGVCRVPMTLFEASFLGWRFSLVRLVVSLPLVIVTSAILGVWFERGNYQLPDVDRT
ncbi:MAG: permease [Pirellulaceae bacterium]